MEKQKTTAHRRFVDDVPQDVKNHRVFEMAQVYRAGAEELNAACVGKQQLILIEGVSNSKRLCFFFLSYLRCRCGYLTNFIFLLGE